MKIHITVDLKAVKTAVRFYSGLKTRSLVSFSCYCLSTKLASTTTAIALRGSTKNKKAIPSKKIPVIGDRYNDVQDPRLLDLKLFLRIDALTLPM